MRDCKSDHKKDCPQLSGTILRINIPAGAVISSHGGPGAIGITGIEKNIE